MGRCAQLSHESILRFASIRCKMWTHGVWEGLPTGVYYDHRIGFLTGCRMNQMPLRLAWGLDSEFHQKSSRRPMPPDRLRMGYRFLFLNLSATWGFSFSEPSVSQAVGLCQWPVLLSTFFLAYHWSLCLYTGRGLPSRDHYNRFTFYVTVSLSWRRRRKADTFTLFETATQLHMLTDIGNGHNIGLKHFYLNT